jgi:hypothetical protein
MPALAHQLLRLLTTFLMCMTTMSFLCWHSATKQLSIFVQGFIALGVMISIDRLFFGWRITASCPECGTRSVAASLKPNSEYLCESPACPLS